MCFFSYLEGFRSLTAVNFLTQEKFLKHIQMSTRVRRIHWQIPLKLFERHTRVYLNWIRTLKSSNLTTHYSFQIEMIQSN